MIIEFDKLLTRGNVIYNHIGIEFIRFAKYNSSFLFTQPKLSEETPGDFSLFYSHTQENAQQRADLQLLDIKSINEEMGKKTHNTL